jgi:lipopolysaccharide/colanic/teichoic acid biosynthesis glycosyltransferase
VSSRINRLGKWVFDRAVGAALLVAAAPIMGLVALVVRARLGRPVLFRQRRPGLHGRPFTIFKFRTMTDARDQNGVLLPDAERVTRTGRVLRAWSLDELPELLNVVRGDMSLVGPRPLLMEYLELYSVEQMRRHDVRPGITGWTQICGRNALSWDEKFALDLWYVENWSFLLDLRILVRTVPALLSRQGITWPGHPTMPNFPGET